MKQFLIVCMSCVYLLSQGSYADDVDIYSDLGSLKGSRNSQLRQNLEADRNGLIRIEDNQELEQVKMQGRLVKLAKIPNVHVDPKLKYKYRYVLPWTAAFLNEYGDIFQKEFKKKFPISSAVRSVERQKEIAKNGNRNAAAAIGDTRSAHLTGAAFDIPKKKLTREEIRWLRKRLPELELKGLLEVTEEYNQAVFHVMVYKHYESAKVKVALQ